MASIRARKVADLLKREIGGILQKGVKDPSIGFVTVTDVEVSPDLRHARVYVSVLGDSARKQEALAALDRARPFIQNEAGERVQLRYVPTLRFCLDESGEYRAKIDSLIERLKAERKAAGLQDENP